LAFNIEISIKSTIIQETPYKGEDMNLRNWAIILVHAFIGWALCAAVMGIGMATVGEGNALIIHLIAAPIFFIIISSVYYKKFNYTSPLITATIFLLFVMGMDFFVVAIIIMRSLVMFTGINGFIGTWLPFSLIFLTTWITGVLLNGKGSLK
jgi:hypothetical protein